MHIYDDEHNRVVHEKIIYETRSCKTGRAMNLEVLKKHNIRCDRCLYEAICVFKLKVHYTVTCVNTKRAMHGATNNVINVK